MTRPHVEVYVRWMEEQRLYAPATTARRLSTVAGYYRFAVIDGYLDRSPAEYVRRPHVPEESQVLGLDRMQLGALVATARASTPDEAALITLGLLGHARAARAALVTTLRRSRPVFSANDLALGGRRREPGRGSLRLVHQPISAINDIEDGLPVAPLGHPRGPESRGVTVETIQRGRGVGGGAAGQDEDELVSADPCD